MSMADDRVLADNLIQITRKIVDIDRRTARMETEVGFGAAPIVAAYTAVGTAALSDDICITNGNFTLNIPSGTGIPGKVYYIKNIGAGTVTVKPAGTTTIDGAGSVTIMHQWDTITVCSQGGNWLIIGTA